MKVHQTAARIWPVLSLLAHQGQLITYGQLNKLIGYGSNHLGQCLEPIQSYCVLNDLPALSVMVVNKENVPGAGFIAETDIDSGQQKVFDFDWLECPTPGERELHLALLALRTCSRPEALKRKPDA